MAGEHLADALVWFCMDCCMLYSLLLYVVDLWTVVTLKHKLYCFILCWSEKSMSLEALWHGFYCSISREQITQKRIVRPSRWGSHHCLGMGINVFTHWMQLVVRLVTFCIHNFCETLRNVLSAEIGRGQYSNVDIPYSSFFYFLRIHQKTPFWG